MAGMPAIRTAVYATISALIWTTLLTFLGYLLGDNWEEVSVYLRTYGAIVTAIIVILIGIQVYFGFRSRRKSVDPDTAGNEGDSPISKTFAE